MIVVAPTGAAAALLGGSTYHSVFGINSKSEGESNSVSAEQVCSRLDGVDYVFLDEVSMLSCIDMYKISEKLAKALNRPEKAFGGKNGSIVVMNPNNGSILAMVSHPTFDNFFYLLGFFCLDFVNFRNQEGFHVIHSQVI